MFRTTQALRPNICNSCSKVNLIKASFGNGGHYFPTVTSLSHSRYVLAQARLTTFWSFCLCMTFPKMRVFILA
jgi:hypothetical protein